MAPTSSRTKSQHWVQCSSPTAFRKHPLHTGSFLYLFLSMLYTAHIYSLNPTSFGKLAYSTNFHYMAGSQRRTSLLHVKSDGFSLKINISRHDKTQSNFATHFCCAWVWVHEDMPVWGVCICVRVTGQLQVLLHPRDLSLTGNSSG